jgi:hypothetical protein
MEGCWEKIPKSKTQAVIELAACAEGKEWFKSGWLFSFPIIFREGRFLEIFFLIQSTVRSFIKEKIEIYRIVEKILGKLELTNKYKMSNINTSPRLVLERKKSNFEFFICLKINSARKISHFSKKEIKYPTLFAALKSKFLFVV